MAFSLLKEDKRKTISKEITIGHVVEKFYQSLDSDCKDAICKIRNMHLPTTMTGIEPTEKTRTESVLLAAQYFQAMFDFKIIDLLRILNEYTNEYTFVPKIIVCHYKK